MLARRLLSISGLFLNINLLIYYAKEKYNIYDKERPENLEGVLPMYFDNQVNA